MLPEEYDYPIGETPQDVQALTHMLATEQQAPVVTDEQQFVFVPAILSLSVNGGDRYFIVEHRR